MADADTGPEAKRRKVGGGDEAAEPAQAAVRNGKADDPRSRSCPYLDTINRQVLDFDFEKLCSVSLSKINVYACLVCGKYFQGRGMNTHAYVHSVAAGHHVFLNLSTLKFYCLPDNYEVIDSSLDDVIYVLKPTFIKEEIDAFDNNAKLCRAFDGTTYWPGVVGLNNIKANDYCNVILQLLSHVPLFRNYFLREDNYEHLAKKRPPGDNLFLIVQRFGELLRKLWNPRNFKAHVSPHEMLQSVVLCSKKRFQITEQSDPIDFLSWFLNSLHQALGGNKKLESSIVSCLRGTMRVYTRKMIPLEKSIDEKLQLMLTDEFKEQSETTQFLYLTLDLPAPPLFKDEMRENIIPQVPLSTLLAKFNGSTEKEYKTYKDSVMKRFQLEQLPRYIILYIKRFTKNTFFVEKNPTIVNFPIKSVDFGELLTPEVRQRHTNGTVYDLIGNVVHEGQPEAGKGAYRMHVRHHGSQKWFEMENLHVTEILPQMIPLSESYIQVWERVQS